jgi:hypothetical protein
VKLDARLQVFDLREYQNDKTLRDLFNYIIFDFITHQLTSSHEKKALFMDEGWTMVNYPSTEDYVRYIIKDSRKYNVSFVFITQELEDMLQSQAGRSILNNTATQFIFHQKESAMALMKTTLNLTPPEYEKLIACGKGEGLMLSDNIRLLFRVRTNQAEHMLITTDPNEKAHAGQDQTLDEYRDAGPRRLGIAKEKREGAVEVHEAAIAEPAPVPPLLPNPDLEANRIYTSPAEGTEAQHLAQSPRVRQPESDDETSEPPHVELPAEPTVKLEEENYIFKKTAPPPKPYTPGIPLAVTKGMVSPKEALHLLQQAADAEKRMKRKAMAKTKKKK